MTLAIAVFASGGGTNLQALLDHFGANGSGGVTGETARAARVSLVVSDRPAAGALERARRAGVETSVISVHGRDPDEVAAEMIGVLRAAEIDLVVLAGYLRLMPPAVVREYRGRMLNIHPALLPAFGGRGMYGAHIHRAVLEAGCTVSGVTVHFVDERYDTGSILLQWPVPVLAGDSVQSLAARVLAVEHRILPVAVAVVAERLARSGAGEEPSVDLPGAGAAGGGVLTAGVPDTIASAAIPERDESSAVVFELSEGSAPTEREARRLLGMESARTEGDN